MNPKFYLPFCSKRTTALLIVCSMLFNTVLGNTIIEGYITNNSSYGNKVFLLEINNIDDLFNGSSHLIIDSAVITQNGHFNFSSQHFGDSSKIYRLNFPPKNEENGAFFQQGTSQHNVIYLFLNQKSKITLTIDAINLSKKYVIKGDFDNSAIKNVQNLLFDRQKIEDSFFNELSNPRANTDSIKKHWLPRYYSQIEQDRISLLNLIDTTQSGAAALVATYYSGYIETISTDVSKVNDIYNRLLHFPSISHYTKQVSLLMRLHDSIMPIGSSVPNFNLVDTSNTVHSLEKIKKQVILIDFWASWCSPCRQENREIFKPLYAKYREKGFEIIGVSLDTDRKKWIKAIEADKLSWLQVSDLKGLNDSDLPKKFYFSSLPTNYITDENGRILAKNVHGDQLIQIVKTLLAK
jgi:thiol-disulfide isomerase/thioredoxin